MNQMRGVTWWLARTLAPLFVVLVMSSSADAQTVVCDWMWACDGYPVQCDYPDYPSMVCASIDDCEWLPFGSDCRPTDYCWELFCWEVVDVPAPPPPPPPEGCDPFYQSCEPPPPPPGDDDGGQGGDPPPCDAPYSYFAAVPSVYAENEVSGSCVISATLSIQVLSPASRQVGLCQFQGETTNARLTASVEVGGSQIPGIYSVNGQQRATLGNGTQWQQDPRQDVVVDNPTCGCAGPLNLGTYYQNGGGGPSFWFNFSDPGQQWQAESWFNEASSWWNGSLAEFGSTQRVTGGGSIEVRLEQLCNPNTPTAPCTAMIFSPADRILRVDPIAFTYSWGFATTLMGHEIGHALGLQHVNCGGEYDALMAGSRSPENVFWGLGTSDRCAVSSHNGSFPTNCGN